MTLCGPPISLAIASALYSQFPTLGLMQSTIDCRELFATAENID